MPEAINIPEFNRGCVTAFKVIFEQHYQRLHHFACSIVDDDNAEDIVQETFIKLWERRESFGNATAIKAFLYLTVKNAGLNIVRHQKVVQDNEHKLPVEHEHDQLLNMIRNEVVSEVRNALQHLPEGYRKVIYLSYFEGKSNQETADLLNISINTVKTQKLRGFKILRTVLRHSPEGLLILFCHFL